MTNPINLFNPNHFYVRLFFFGTPTPVPTLSLSYFWLFLAFSSTCHPSLGPTHRDEGMPGQWQLALRVIHYCKTLFATLQCCMVPYVTHISVCAYVYTNIHNWHCDLISLGHHDTITSSVRHHVGFAVILNFCPHGFRRISLVSTLAPFWAFLALYLFLGSAIIWVKIELQYSHSRI